MNLWKIYTWQNPKVKIYHGNKIKTKKSNKANSKLDPIEYSSFDDPYTTFEYFANRMANARYQSLWTKML